MPKDFNPLDIGNAQGICALRFEGYEYEEQLSGKGAGGGGGLSALAEPIIETLTLHNNQNHNFAAFFILQRFLAKWGGETLPESSKEHIAYDFLFLHLYRIDPPEPFRHEDYCLEWQQEFAPHAEAIAAGVRKRLLSHNPGRSPETEDD
jgi:hypothetical protein